MERRFDLERGPRRSLSAQEAERLFSTVDNSGHANEKEAAEQRARRLEKGHGVEVDPLSEDDPSGSNVSRVIHRTGIILLAVVFAIIITIQVIVIVARRDNTANLSNNVTISTVAAALNGGIEWGGGYTQFPADFSVQEADENSHRIEITVVDTTSSNALLCFSNSQIQATAFSINSLLNPKIDTVIYHVKVHLDENKKIEDASWFGFKQPTGSLSPFITFIWTKDTSADGQVHFNCTIAGVDDDLQESLRSQFFSQMSEEEDESPEATSDSQ